jgi:hypothetical protein
MCCWSEQDIYERLHSNLSRIIRQQMTSYHLMLSMNFNVSEKKRKREEKTENPEKEEKKQTQPRDRP